MTQEQTKLVIDMVPIMKAYVNGKSIQERLKGGEWVDVYAPSWTPGYEYRIKPDKKVMPFKSMLEFCKAWDGMLIKNTSNDISYEVNRISRNGITLITGSFWTWDDLLNVFEFSDGTPCGKIVETYIIK